LPYLVFQWPKPLGNLDNPGNPGSLVPVAVALAVQGVQVVRGVQVEPEVLVVQPAQLTLCPYPAANLVYSLQHHALHHHQGLVLVGHKCGRRHYLVYNLLCSSPKGLPFGLLFSLNIRFTHAK
jgi:hypothetical protein